MKDTPLPLEAFQEAKALINAAQRIVILSHRNPDADSVGANLALREALEHEGKQVTSACVDPIPESCQFLRGADQFVQDFDLADHDIVISLDCGGHKLLGFHKSKPELLDPGACTLINIDHHPSNDHFGRINIVMSSTPATCFILFLMFNSFSWTITPSMATSLLHGLYYDTGSFMHSNTSADALRIAARLKALGGDHETCVRKEFRTRSLQRLRLWGRALSRLELNQNQAAVSAITAKDFEEEDAQLGDLTGLINYLNHVPEAKFAMLLTEDGKGNIKGSLRTQQEAVDLSEIAGLFGGGGHKKAAGFTIPGRIQEKRSWSIV